MRIRWATVPVTVGATLALTAAAAFGATIMVDQDSLASPGNCAGSGPAYPTIQGGVNAASPGDTVEVCGAPAPYAGATVNTPDVHLLGVNDPVVSAPGATAITLNGNNDSISKFRITNSATGITTSPLASGYLISRNTIFNNSIGIFLGSSGATPTLVTRNTIANNNVPGAASGTGIYSDVALNNAVISFNRFDNNDNEQINITPSSGASDSGLTIQHNTFTNGGNTDVAFCPGCSSGVNNSTISNNKMTGEFNGNGSEIFIGGTSTNDTLQNNKITNSNFNGIAIRDTAQGISIVSNRITHPFNNGIDVSSTKPGAVTVTSNRVANAGNIGINMQAGTNQNRLTSNHATGSAGPFNCQDQNGLGTTNVWTSDTAAPSFPPGICH
jgi:parallel beta-helix repeat protein